MSIFIFLANFQVGHFPDLTHSVAAQTVELADIGMGEWPREGTGQLPASGSPHLCKSELATELAPKTYIVTTPGLWHNQFVFQDGFL